MAKTRAETLALIRETAAELKPAVAIIEAKVPITRGHYDDYMSMFSTLTPDDPRGARILALALSMAGADKGGVQYAFKIVYGEPLL